MTVTEIDVLEHRSPEHEVLDPLVERWSPRAMSGETITDGELNRLFEAARWAPSSYNGQPWRFLYARRGGEQWERFFGLLGDFNQSWCDRAAVLVVVVSRDTFERNGKPARTHSFDTGAAWQNLALQGTAIGLVVHGMQGFDYDRAREELGIPDDHTVEAMIAVGRPGELDDLDPDLREKEQPSQRKPIEEIAFEGRFPS